MDQILKLTKKKFVSEKETGPCPQCGILIGVISGSKEVICTNCGFKDPCCE